MFTNLKIFVVKLLLIYTWLNETKILGKMYHNHFARHKINYGYLAPRL